MKYIALEHFYRVFKIAGECKICDEILKCFSFKYYILV